MKFLDDVGYCRRGNGIVYDLNMKKNYFNNKIVFIVLYNVLMLRYNNIMFKYTYFLRKHTILIFLFFYLQNTKFTHFPEVLSKDIL